VDRSPVQGLLPHVRKEDYNVGVNLAETLDDYDLEMSYKQFIVHTNK
jgi:hypothetical protein